MGNHFQPSAEPNLAQAIGYALAILPAGVRLCGSTISPEGDGVRDVLFLLPGETGRPNRFSVWWIGSGLYGEW